MKMIKRNGSSNSGGGIGFFGLLGVVFITLKLTEVINWSWWLVLLPLYGPLCLLLFIVMIIFIAALLIEFGKQNSGRRW